MLGLAMASQGLPAEELPSWIVCKRMVDDINCWKPCLIFGTLEMATLDLVFPIFGMQTQMFGLRFAWIFWTS